MRKYYTRPCNFYYGRNAYDLIKNRQALPLAGSKNLAFDQIEIFQRGKRNTNSEIISIKAIAKLKGKKKIIIKKDIKNIISKRKKILNLNFNNPQIMGVLNVTPDSFSDGGLFFSKTKAYKQAKNIIEGGSTIVDIGGESTRPGSKTINEKVEWKRVKNIIEILKKKFPKVVLSLDTRKSYIMINGIKKGISIINDVSGLNFDKKSFDLINSIKIPFILHHMQGTPNTMQLKPAYKDALLDIYDFFEKKINYSKNKNIILDPGIGFGKNLKHNLRILSKISTFHSLGYPILIGPSRKRFIEHIVTKFDTQQRIGGTLSSVLYGLSQGVQLFRVHDVKEINQGILVFKKILGEN
jgi:dihydropteroate synthase